MLTHKTVIRFAVVALAFLTIDVACAEGACNPAIQKWIAGKKISFDAATVDKAKLGVEDAVFAVMKKRAELGGVLFHCANKAAFLEAQARLFPKADAGEFVAIGWFVPGENRYVGPTCGRTTADVTAMTDEEFDAWRKGWNMGAERALARISPPPSRSGGKVNTRFVFTRALVLAKDKAGFLKRVEEEVKKGEKFRITYMQKCDMVKQKYNSHMYSLSLPNIGALTDGEFLTWRARFLRWVELHEPGQSNVPQFAKLGGMQFEAYIAKCRTVGTSMFAVGMMKMGIARLDGWCGIGLEFPDYAAGEVEAVVKTVRKGTPAEAAGLKPGHIILEVEGADIEEWDDLAYTLASFQPGSKVKLVVETDPEKAPEDMFYTVGKLFTGSIFGKKPRR